LTRRIADWVRRQQPGLRWLREPTILLGLLLVLVLGAQSWNVGRQNPQVDYYQFWAVGRLTTTEKDIYSGEARRTLGGILQVQSSLPGTTPREANAARTWPVLQTTGTPFMYSVFGILQTGDFERDSSIFEFLSMAVFLLAMLWLALRVGLGLLTSLLLLAVVLGTSFPLWIDLYVGNLNQLQVGLMVGYLALRVGPQTLLRATVAGAIFGVAVVFKPNLGFIVALLVAELIIRGRWRDLLSQGAGFTAAALAAVGVSLLRFGSLDPWFGWLDAFTFLTTTTGYPVQWGNFSLDRLLREQTGAELSLYLFAVLGAVVVGALAWSARRARKAPWGDAPAPDAAEDRRWARELLIIGVAVAVTVFASPLSWPHYYLSLVPLIAFLLRPAGTRFGGSAPVLVRQGVAAAALLLMTVKQEHALASTGEALPYLLALGGAAAILMITAIWELAGTPRSERAAEPELAGA
jgi:hypothetical protein